MNRIDPAESRHDARPNSYLAPLDQALFDGHRISGQNEIMQAVWIYEHPLDFDGLMRIHRDLGEGLLGRLIERSPLPFGRHRWVADRAPRGIDIAEAARSRAEVSDWADERAQVPIDAERGPGWHLGVLPLTDGSTAVSLVVSHYVVDGIGFFVALFEASLGNKRDFPYPPPRSSSKPRAMAQDARQTARDTPDVLKAIREAAKMSREIWGNTRPHAPAASVNLPEGDGVEATEEPFIVPWVTVHIRLGDWEARAHALGGTTTTLGAGLTAKLGERMGRQRPDDGAITLLILASQRTADDTRALALSYPRISVDPAGLTTDLRDTRAAIKRALKANQETPDDALRFAPLTPFTPKRLLKQMIEASLVAPDRPVVYSNLGAPPQGARGVDGTDAESVTARGTKQNLTRRWLERTGGELIVASATFPNRITLNIQAYQPGAENTKAALGELAARTLAEFGLTATIE